jgi:predicted 3-demethylubiquinone-9 3-methyltransferase (glyoxalase superfamily)
LLVGLWSRHGRRLRERRRLERAVICIDSPVKHAFTFTPAMSLYAECESEAEFNAAFGQLSEEGTVLMPSDNYGFSRRFGWVNDRYGVSWQLNLQ